MIKKSYNNDLFNKLDWVLKKKGKLLSSSNNISLFIFNRWLSMANASVAQIVNATTNRWILQKEYFTEESFFLNFFKIILPKINKKVSYLKKNPKQKPEEDYINLANSLEISKREINFYEKTLAEIEKKVK